MQRGDACSVEKEADWEGEKELEKPWVREVEQVRNAVFFTFVMRYV